MERLTPLPSVPLGGVSGEPPCVGPPVLSPIGWRTLCFPRGGLPSRLVEAVPPHELILYSSSHQKFSSSSQSHSSSAMHRSAFPQVKPLQVVHADRHFKFAFKQEQWLLLHQFCNNRILTLKVIQEPSDQPRKSRGCIYSPPASNQIIQGRVILKSRPSCLIFEYKL